MGDTSQSSPWSFLRKSGLAFFPLLLFLLGCVISYWFSSLQYRYDLDRAREHLNAELDTIRGNLSRELYAGIYLTEGIPSLVKTEGDISEQQFQALAGELLSHNPLIRNIALAPNNVVRYE